MHETQKREVPVYWVEWDGVGGFYTSSWAEEDLYQVPAVFQTLPVGTCYAAAF